MYVDAEAPTGDVELMHAVVSGVAGAEVVPPVPIVMLAIGLKRHHRRRTDPEIVVESAWRFARLQVADIFPPLTIPGFGDDDLADDAPLQLGEHFTNEGRRARLRPDLNDLFRALGRFHHEPAFANVV